MYLREFREFVGTISIKLLCCSLLVAMVCGCSTWPYSGHSIKGRVVDSATGQPLEGVMVVAYWRTSTKGITPGIYIDSGPPPSCLKLANLLTASSGSDGVFEIPAWSGTGCFTMYGAEPEFIVYKPGYKIQLLFNVDILNSGDKSNYQTSGPIGAWGRTDGGTVFIWTSSKWDGATIKLEPDSDDMRNLGLYMNWISDVLMQPDPSRCFWKEASPAFAFAIQQEWLMGEPSGQGMEDKLRMSYAPNRMGDSTCGSIEDYIQSLSKEADQGSWSSGTGPISPTDLQSFKLDQGFIDHFRLFVLNLRRYVRAHPDFSTLGDDRTRVQHLYQDPATRELFSESGVTPRDVAVGSRSIMYGNLLTSQTHDQQQCLAWAQKDTATVDAATIEWRRNFCMHKEELNALLNLWESPWNDWPTSTLGAEP